MTSSGISASLPPSSRKKETAKFSPARLTRANLLQTLVSFDGALDARLEFHFGLFADNTCRLRDGLDNKALGL